MYSLVIFYLFDYSYLCIVIYIFTLNTVNMKVCGASVKYFLAFLTISLKYIYVCFNCAWNGTSCQMWKLHCLACEVK